MLQACPVMFASVAVSRLSTTKKNYYTTSVFTTVFSVRKWRSSANTVTVRKNYDSVQIEGSLFKEPLCTNTRGRRLNSIACPSTCEWSHSSVMSPAKTFARCDSFILFVSVLTPSSIRTKPHKKLFSQSGSFFGFFFVCLR